MNVTCSCGSTINDEDIGYWNGCNEEGEDYGMVAATCESCGKEWEASQWGEWDSRAEAVEYLQDYIKIP